VGEGQGGEQVRLVLRVGCSPTGQKIGNIVEKGKSPSKSGGKKVGKYSQSKGLLQDPRMAVGGGGDTDFD